jgi:hypothetical protein
MTKQAGGVVAGTGQELARRNGRPPATVDPEDEPSAAWGWHGSFPRGSMIAGWATVLILIAMNFTNNNSVGNMANVWLTGLAVLMALGLIRHSIRKRTSWRG